MLDFSDLGSPDPFKRDLAYLRLLEELLGPEWVERWTLERGKMEALREWRGARSASSSLAGGSLMPSIRSRRFSQSLQMLACSSNCVQRLQPFRRPLRGHARFVVIEYRPNGTFYFFTAEPRAWHNGGYTKPFRSRGHSWLVSIPRQQHHGHSVVQGLAHDPMPGVAYQDCAPLQNRCMRNESFKSCVARNVAKLLSVVLRSQSQQ